MTQLCCKFYSQLRHEANPGILHAHSHLWWFLKSWVGAGSIFGQLPCLPYVVGTSRRNQQPGPAGPVLSHPSLTQVERKEQREKSRVMTQNLLKSTQQYNTTAVAFKFWKCCTSFHLSGETDFKMKRPWDGRRVVTHWHNSHSRNESQNFSSTD